MGTREETREEVDEQPSHMIPRVHVCRRSGLGPCTHVRDPKPDLREGAVEGAPSGVPALPLSAPG